MRKKMSWFTIALLISLTLWGIFSLLYSVVTLFLLVPAILYALAIIGIVNHYRLGEKAPRLRWGPLCGIAAASFNLAGIIIYGGDLRSTIFLWPLCYVPLFLTVGWPSYVEYLKEGAPVTTERLTQVVLSQRLSAELTRQIKNIEVAINQIERRVRRDLTCLTVAVPIIVVVVSFVIVMSFTISAGSVGKTGYDFVYLVVAIIFTGSGIFFLIFAASFSFLLKKPRYTLLTINHSNTNLDSIAASQVRSIVKDARKRLAIFLLAYAAPAVLYVAIICFTSYFTSSHLVMMASASLVLLSALACFLMGYWVLTRDRITTVALSEPALHGVLEESVGLLPNKVRAADVHSVLMDFNITGVPPSAIAAVTRSAPGPIGDVPASDTDALRPYYEIELQAAGAAVDGAKQCAIFDAPTTCKRIWSCSFGAAGSQVLRLLFNEVHPAQAQIRDEAFFREPLLTYVHNVRVDGRFTASPDNAVSMIGIGITVVSILVSLSIAVH
jgi:hypothetical protein